MATQINFGEMVARRGVSRDQQLQDVFGKVGSFYPLRENFRLTLEAKAKFTEKLTQKLRAILAILYGSKVAVIVRINRLNLLVADGSRVATGCQARSGWCASVAKHRAGKV